MFKGYLLDTSVISVLAPGRESLVAPPLAQWLRAHHQRLYLPAVAVAEMAQSIGKLRRAGRPPRPVARRPAGHIRRPHLAAGRPRKISASAMAQGCHPGFADVAIAALAQHAGLLLLICNLKHFQPLGVACTDPLLALPIDP